MFEIWSWPLIHLSPHVTNCKSMLMHNYNLSAVLRGNDTELLTFLVRVTLQREMTQRPYGENYLVDL